MGTHTINRTSVPATRTGGDHGRLLFTIVGGAALVVSAFLNWTRDMTATTLSNHSLINTSFLTQTDVVRTVGGIAVVIGLVGMFGVVDRTGWLTRLAGLLGVALFVMFVIEVYRSNVHTMQAGAWLALGGGIVMLIGGFLPGYGSETRGEPLAVEERRMDRLDQLDPAAGPVNPRRYETETGADAESESEPHGGRA